MSDASDSTMPEDPIPPYTIHLWFPWLKNEHELGGEYEYLLRHTQEDRGETNETGFVLEPIGEIRSEVHQIHQALMEDSLEMAIEDLEMNDDYIPDVLCAIAELLVKDMKGRIVAINDPEPSSDDYDPDIIF